MSLKNMIKNNLSKMPYIRALVSENKKLKQFSMFPPGHFYSPIVDTNNIEKSKSEIWKERTPTEIHGISFNDDAQRTLLGKLAQFYDDLPFEDTKQPGLRYYYKNKFYSYTDAIVLFGMLRHLKPKRVIEIGSGFSSAIMLDTNELFFDNKIQLSFIEPYPERLRSLMTEKDSKTSKVYETFIQQVDTSIFTELEAGDIVFVDSSHIVKTGSDVNFILFEILPLLKKGVFIHFHDIFYPFEYPEKWVMKGFNWNEDYFLRAFLMYNDAFEIALFSHYLHKRHPKAFTNMPLAYQSTGGNLWLRKT